jgi:hypothetical protein
MKTRVNDALREEAARFVFRFACEDCVHSVEHDGLFRCSLGYPAAPRREAIRDAEMDLCKEFELG